MDYSEFRQQYEQMHPASIPERVPIASEFPRWLPPVSVGMFLASAFVSGLHTASAVHSTLTYTWTAVQQFKDIAAVASFFGFELLLLLSMFAWLRSRGRRLAYITTAVVFGVVLLTNVSDVARSASTDLLGALTIFGLGLGTPLVVLLSGKLLMDTYHSGRLAAQREEEAYRAQCIAWDKTIAAAWKASQRGVSKVSDEVSGQPDSSTQVDRALSYLRQASDVSDLSVRKLSDRANVGRDAAWRALQLWREQTPSNGHFSDDGNT